LFNTPHRTWITEIFWFWFWNLHFLALQILSPEIIPEDTIHAWRTTGECLVDSAIPCLVVPTKVQEQREVLLPHQIDQVPCPRVLEVFVSRGMVYNKITRAKSEASDAVDESVPPSAVDQHGKILRLISPHT
jgi:hypothetical protein